MSEKACIFCQRVAKLTSEHIWPVWMSRVFESDGPRQYICRQKAAGGITVKQWKSRSLDLKARVVCQHCNNGWMSDLENRQAKPVMKDMIKYGSLVSLLPSGIASIAALAFKTAVVADHMNPTRKPFFMPSARHRFAASLKFPDKVRMWIAMFSGTSLRSGRLVTYYTTLRLAGIKQLEFYVCTFVAGHVAFQVVAPRRVNIHRRKLQFPFLVQEQGWDKFAIPFWPNDGTPILWPPGQPLDDQILDAFCKRSFNFFGSG